MHATCRRSNLRARLVFDASWSDMRGGICKDFTIMKIPTRYCEQAFVYYGEEARTKVSEDGQPALLRPFLIGHLARASILVQCVFIGKGV